MHANQGRDLTNAKKELQSEMYIRAGFLKETAKKVPDQLLVCIIGDL